MPATTTPYDPNKPKPAQQQVGATSTQPGTMSATSQPTYNATNYNSVQQPTYQNYTAQQTSVPGSTVDYGTVNNQINKAANTLSTPTMQNGNMVGQLTGDILNSMDPVRRQQQANTNQQYNQSSRKLSEMLAAKGLSRGGYGTNQMMGLEQSRNQTHANNNSQLISDALAQALPFGQLQLSERSLLQGQQSNAADQYANLLNQQTGHQLAGQDFNANQAMYANSYNNNLSQQGYENMLNQLGLQGSENQFAAQFGQSQYQGGLDEAYRQAQMAQQGTQFDQQMGLSQQELAQQNSQFGQQLAQQNSQFGQQLTADQANQQAQQAIQNRQLDLQQQGMSADEAYRQAQFEESQRQFNTGQNNWQSQFDTGNQQWQQQFDTGNQQWQQSYDQQGQQLQQNLLGSLLGYGGTLAGSTPNAPVPENWGPLLSQLLGQMMNNGGSAA